MDRTPRTYLLRGVEIVVSSVAVALLAAHPVRAQESQSLFEMSLEELVNLEVTSVSARSERLAETTSAVYVVTCDDILRYGIGSVPEALRLVPGLSVLQIDANKWAIGSRGFTGRFANKLLVLMDGRVLYTPSFSGVFWDVQDTLLEDIARIEVIRGPGSTIWGANAVNGVINIITRSASEDQGGRLQTRLESGGGYTMSARFSGAPSDASNYRVFLKHQDGPSNHDLTGRSTTDDWQMTRIGARADWTPTPVDSVSFSSEIYDGTMGNSLQVATVTPPYVTAVAAVTNVSGLFAIGDWSHQHSDSVSSNARLTIDETDRDSAQFSEGRRTYALDVQHRRTYSRHDLVVGAEYRANSFDITGSATVSIGLPTNTNNSFSAFIQDQITLVPNRFRLTLGTKIEHNELSNRQYDLMPSARLLWHVSPETTVWGAVTRAIRTPSYADLYARVLDVDPVTPPLSGVNPFPLPLRRAAVGSASFVSEEVVAYEMGLRGRIGASTNYDLSVYHMDYDHLRAYQPTGVVCNPSGQSVMANPLCLFASDSVIAEIQFNNEASGEVRGLELALTWDISDRWRVHGSYAYADETQRAAPPSVAPTMASGPKQQSMLRSEWSISSRVSLAAWLRYVDDIPSLPIGDYWQANLQVGWRVSDRWQLSVGGQNLLGKAKVEYLSELNDVTPTEIERRLYLRANWTF